MVWRKRIAFAHRYLICSRKSLFLFSFTLYKLRDETLSLSDPNSSSAPASRRWTIVAAGLLLVALAVVVIYTSRGAFFSPLALMVVAAIGLAALLLQLRFRQDVQAPVRSPLWLNAVAIAFAGAAVLADIFRLSETLLLAAALAAVVCFAISGIVVLGALRKKRA